MLLAGLACCLFAIVVANAVSAKHRAAALACTGSVGCALIFVAAGRALLDGRVSTFHTSSILPLMGFDLTLDPLGALFVAVASFAGVAALIYSIGYAHDELRSRPALSLLMLFVISLVIVPVASSVATFMFAWELMAVSSTLLIVVEHRRRPEARIAAQWYAAMTQIGASFILLGLLLLSSKDGGTFVEVTSHATGLSLTVRSCAFVLTLIGFASKAGAVPFHVWLPKAHPEAASPVSALMSGVMVAMGVYGVVRVGYGLLGGGVLWWWTIVVALGVASALFGALHAATSIDVKRLLAYSTIDILGLVLIGVGCSGALTTTGHPGVARLALLGALTLVVAHAAMKSLLFLAAGAVERASGTRSLDQLGGLIRRIPVTTALFCVGALSLVAVPAFAGFSSEWLLLQGLLHGFVDHHALTLIVLLAGVVALALTGGLTAVALVKAFGIGFLGQPRSSGASEAREVPWSMHAGMLMLAMPCVALGVAPGLVVTALDRVVATVETGGGSLVKPGIGLALTHLHGMIEPMFLLALFAGIVAFTRTVSSWRRAPARHVEAWRGGASQPTSRMQYTATSYAEPLQRVFVDVLRPEVDLEVTHAVESRYYEQSLSYESQVDDAVERLAYLPALRRITRAGESARRLQNGSIHRYLAFGLVALIIVLVVLA